MAASSSVGLSVQRAADAAVVTHDFSAAAGPLPQDVVESVAEACRDWRGLGSVLSLPFTSDAFRSLMHDTGAMLRELLDIPESHDILFLQGGASAQFALVPINLADRGETAAYVDTGHWSQRAIGEALRHCMVSVAATSAATGYDRVPDFADWQIDPACAYLHITSNETAGGLQYCHMPRSGVPLIVDMTSDFLTRPVDWSRVALAYAAAQKTIGVPGLTCVVLKRDLLGRVRSAAPGVFDYSRQAAAESRVNTPPVFAIFVAHAMLKWIAGHGGLAAVASAVARRSARVYAALDREAGFYGTPARAADRSRTSVCFRAADRATEEALLEQAARQGLRGLRGHPATGGARAAIYAGTTDQAVDALSEFLIEFQRTRG